jgi:hypothetical protein
VTSLRFTKEFCFTQYSLYSLTGPNPIPKTKAVQNRTLNCSKLLTMALRAKVGYNVKAMERHAWKKGKEFGGFLRQAIAGPASTAAGNPRLG